MLPNTVLAGATLNPVRQTVVLIVFFPLPLAQDVTAHFLLVMNGKLVILLVLLIFHHLLVQVLVVQLYHLATAGVILMTALQDRRIILYRDRLERKVEKLN
jgi:hypothetical protein